MTLPSSAFILGLGVSGKAAASFLLEKGSAVFATDQKIKSLLGDSEVRDLIDRGMQIVPEEETSDKFNADALIVSPGISLTHPQVLRARKKSIPVMGEMELALPFLSQKVLGVTGTNGKTTVVSLVAHVLNYAGVKAHALGNIGMPVTKALLQNRLQPEDILVLELSSYQLELLPPETLDCGIVLNLTPDHLDRYGSMEAYVRAKFRLFECLKSGGKGFVEQKAFCDYQPLFPAVFSHQVHICQWPSQESIDSIPPLSYIKDKKFEYYNHLAAQLLCKECEVEGAMFWEGVKTFQKPPHRLQWIRELGGVSYYDDSKGTNLGAVEQAVSAMPGKVVLIAGGQGKGVSFSPWVASFREKVQAIFAIGEAREDLKRDLGENYPVHLCENLKEALGQARRLARKGDAILLSPGCASFDMFANYMERGERFQELVWALNEEGRV